jgi:hypothetical protein
MGFTSSAKNEGNCLSSAFAHAKAGLLLMPKLGCCLGTCCDDSNVPLDETLFSYTNRALPVNLLVDAFTLTLST